MADTAYWALVALAAAVSFLLAFALTHYLLDNGLDGLKRHRERNTQWVPATREVGNQTWIVVQLKHHGLLGHRIVAEQLVAVITHKHDDYNHELTREQRLAELHAAWLNKGEPTSPKT